MKMRIMFAFGCMYFLVASSNVLAAETAAASEPILGVNQAVVDIENIAEENKDPKLQKWLQEIKPAAGTQYWEKRVVRRSNRRRVTGQE